MFSQAQKSRRDSGRAKLAPALTVVTLGVPARPARRRHCLRLVSPPGHWPVVRVTLRTAAAEQCGSNL